MILIAGSTTIPSTIRYQYICRNHKVISSSMTCHRACNKSKTTGVLCGARTAYPSGAFEFTTTFSGFRVVGSLVFCVVLWTSFFVLLFLFFWPSQVKFFIKPQIHLSVQEEVNMKYIHTTDGKQVNLHNVYSTYNNQVDL